MANTSDISGMYGAVESTTFMGLPELTEPRAGFSSIIVGAPSSTPYESVGTYCSEAPDAIRAAYRGYSSNIEHMDFDFMEPLFPFGIDAADMGNLEWSETDFEFNRNTIRSAVRSILGAGAVPVVLGGDDSIPIPMIQAYEGLGEFFIVQIDAHTDFRDVVRGENLGLSSTMRRSMELDFVTGMVQVGQRGIGSTRPQDYQDALAMGVKYVPARQVHSQGIQTAIDLVPAGSNVIFDFDCDALDPSVNPGAIGRAPGGLTYWHVVELIHGVAQKAKISGFNLVEYMPDVDVDAIGALNNARIICNVLGEVTRQANR